VVRNTLSVGGSVPVIGAGFLTSPAEAALANGYAAHAVEMDENFLIGLGHLCAVVVPAILSVGYEADLRGRQALDALIVASEVMARVGSALDRAHTDRGWHGTSTIGALAAAVACGRLMRLAAPEMTHALALSVSMSAGPKVQFGTEAKPLHAGLAAQAGVTAARLARSGLRASDKALEGACGFGELYAGVRGADWSGALPREGEPLAIEWSGMAFKLWPSCGATHKAIAGVLALRQHHGFGADDVESVVVEVSHGIMLNLRYPEPKNHKEAQFSMQYAIALALRFGRLTLADYTAEAVQDEATRRLMPRVTMVKYPGSAQGTENAASHMPHRPPLRTPRAAHERRPWGPVHAGGPVRQVRHVLCRCAAAGPPGSSPAHAGRTCGRAAAGPDASADVRSRRRRGPTFRQAPRANGSPTGKSAERRDLLETLRPPAIDVPWGMSPPAPKPRGLHRSAACGGALRGSTGSPSNGSCARGSAKWRHAINHPSLHDHLLPAIRHRSSQGQRVRALREALAAAGGKVWRLASRVFPSIGRSEQHRLGVVLVSVAGCL
jgi:2-methylcitrate dehydratase PrpD